MDFHNFTIFRNATKRSGVNETADEFHRSAYAAAVTQGFGVRSDLVEIRRSR